MEAVRVRRPGLALGFALLLAVCRPADVPQITDELFASLVADAMTVSRGEIAPTCNGGGSAAMPDTALILGTNLCLSCAAVGPLLRDRVRLGRRDVLVVAYEDAPHICRFLQAERAPVPVYGIAGPEFARAMWLPRVVVADLHTGAWHTVSVAEQDVGSLEPSVRR